MMTKSQKGLRVAQGSDWPQPFLIDSFTGTAQQLFISDPAKVFLMSALQWFKSGDQVTAMEQSSSLIRADRLQAVYFVPGGRHS